MWNETLQAILVVLVQVLTPVLAAYAVVLLNEGIKWVKAKLTGDQYAFTVDLVTKLVQAAEQTFPHEELNEKKAWVLAQAEAELAKRGIVVDLDVLENLLEAAVWEQFKKVEY